jgi:hypothetical protein
MGLYMNGFAENNHKAAVLATLDGVTEFIDIVPVFLKVKSGNMLIAVVENGPFDAAAVAFNKDEFKEFTRTNDFRAIRYFSVPVEVIKEFAPDFEKYVKGDNQNG